MKIKSLLIAFFIQFTFFPSLFSIDTLRYEPLQTVKISPKISSVKKAGEIVNPEINSDFVKVKRIKNPSDQPIEYDMERVEMKRKQSIEMENRGDYRREDKLKDSMRVETSYISNNFNFVTPMDNHIAVSKNGVVISVVNINMMITDTIGNPLTIPASRVFNASFFGDQSLTATIYDPKILYDPDANRFILVVLHGSTSASSQVLVMFSKSENPHIDGWNYYKFPGNPFAGSLWFDYPNTGINKNNLFITGNMFDDNDNFREPVIFQLNKFDGYNGSNNINMLTWGSLGGPNAIRIKNNSGIEIAPFTLVPAPNGWRNDNFTDMHFVNTYSHAGDEIHLLRITNIIGNNPQLEVGKVALGNNNNYQMEGLVPQPKTDTLLMSGDARIKNAYILNNVLHLVFNARVRNYSGIHYYRIDLKSRLVFVSKFGDDRNDYAYPVISPFSNDSTNQTALIAYVYSSSVNYPSIGVMTCNGKMEFSKPLTVKEGESYVSILPEGFRTRWGDYSGAAKRFGSSQPEVWITGSYGFFTPHPTFSRRWNNYNAKITSIDNPIVYYPENPDVSLWPNPAPKENPIIHFKLVAEEGGDYKIKIFDNLGKEIKTIYEETILTGVYQVVFSTQFLSPGIYYVRYYLNDRPKGFVKFVVP
jgi:hypothetical protein